MLLTGVLVTVGGVDGARAEQVPGSSSDAGVMHVVAGVGRPGQPAGDGGPATAAQLSEARDVAHDAAGNMYIATSAGQVRRVDARTGIISTLQGVQQDGGPARPADQKEVTGVAVDRVGNVFAAGFPRTVEYTTDGRVVVLAGLGAPGPAAARTWNVDVAVDAAGAAYVADAMDMSVQRIGPDGSVTRIAGYRPGAPLGDGGPASAASMGQPLSLTFGQDGSLFVLEAGRVRRIDPTGTISTVAGGGTAICEAPGARDANLDFSVPSGIALDRAGRLLITQAGYHRVLRLDADGRLRTVLGQGISRLYPPLGVPGLPGPLTPVQSPSGVDVLPDGTMLVAEAYRLLAVTPGDSPGVALPVAGTGDRGLAGNNGDGGPACEARLAYPTSLATTPDGSTYVADYQNNQIRRLTTDGRISTVAGTGLPGFSGDGGPAAAAQLNHPRGVAVDPTGRLLIADVVNNRIRRVDPTTGTITTIAGTGTWGSSGDGGPATAAQLAGPHAVTTGPDGAVYIADTGNHRVRRLDPTTGTITTLAGTGAPGGAGDGGPAAAAQLDSPRALSVHDGALYVSDPGTRSVRRIDLTTGRITTLTGSSSSTSEALTNPAELLPTASGLLITDAGTNRVLLANWTTGTTTVWAGTGATGPLGSPGAARTPTSLTLAQPQGLARDATGGILLADTAHHRILHISQ